MAATIRSLPIPTVPVIDRQTLLMTKEWYDYFTALNAFLASESLTNLKNFANDAAAATGGVPIGGFYRNGSVRQIRVT